MHLNLFKLPLCVAVQVQIDLGMCARQHIAWVAAVPGGGCGVAYYATPPRDIIGSGHRVALLIKIEMVGNAI